MDETLADQIQFTNIQMLLKGNTDTKYSLCRAPLVCWCWSILASNTANKTSPRRKWSPILPCIASFWLNFSTHITTKSRRVHASKWISLDLKDGHFMAKLKYWMSKISPEAACRCVKCDKRHDFWWNVNLFSVFVSSSPSVDGLFPPQDKTIRIKREGRKEEVFI